MSLMAYDGSQSSAQEKRLSTRHKLLSAFSMPEARMNTDRPQALYSGNTALTTLDLPVNMCSAIRVIWRAKYKMVLCFEDPCLTGTDQLNEDDASCGAVQHCFVEAWSRPPVYTLHRD